MPASHLVVLPPPTEPESPADGIRRLQAEAKALARQHIETLAVALSEVSRVTAEIAEGGDFYPVGARELSRRLAEDCGKHALTLAAIAERS
jgi:hypothetical protein